ncbi:MAG: hypothetical protein ACI4TU_01855 [Candidatus Cryptobacteroides sp.]
MKRFGSAKEELDYIKKEILDGKGLGRITGLTAEERMGFLMEQANNVMEDQGLAEWLGVQFWKTIYDDTEGIRRHRELNPILLFNIDSQLSSFSEEELSELAFVKDLSALCFDLAILRNADTTVLGWPKYEPLDYSAPNLLDHVAGIADQLPNLAAFLSKAIYENTMNFCAWNMYQPAQDYFADLYDNQHRYRMSRIPQDDSMPRSEYSKTMMSEIRKFTGHISECRRHGMCLGAIIVHDTLYATLPEDVSDNAANAAKRLWEYIYNNVELSVEGLDTNKIFEEQPDEVVNDVRNVMGAMMKKVDEAYVEGGLAEEYSTDRLARAYFDEFGYKIICMKYDGDEEGLHRLQI